MTVPLYSLYSSRFIRFIKEESNQRWQEIVDCPALLALLSRFIPALWFVQYAVRARRIIFGRPRRPDLLMCRTGVL